MANSRLDSSMMMVLRSPNPIHAEKYGFEARPSSSAISKTNKPIKNLSMTKDGSNPATWHIFLRTINSTLWTGKRN
jgi:hypothetical protein